MSLRLLFSNTAIAVKLPSQQIYSLITVFIGFLQRFGVTLTKLSTYLRHGSGLYVIGVTRMIISVSLDMLAPQLTRLLVDDVIVGGKIELLTKLLLGYLAVGVGRAVFQL